MKITSYIASLADVEYTPDTIVSDIMSNLENLEKIVIPSLQTLSRLENDKSNNIKAGKRYTSLILKNLNGSKRHVSDTLLGRVPLIKKNIEHLSKQYSKIFTGKSIHTEGLTMKKATFIAELDMAHSFIVYTMDLADVLARSYSGESSIKSSNIYDIERYEEVRLNDGLLNFVKVTNHLSMDSKSFKSHIDKQLDIVVDENNQAYASAGGGSLELPIVNGFIGNPLYHVGKSIAEYQAKRYKSMVAKKRSLELYTLDLEDSKDGRNNTAVEKEIVYNRKRLQALDMDIKKIESE